MTVEPPHRRRSFWRRWARMALGDELAYMTATELAARIRRRELSPVEVVDACIERSRPETTA
jgi:hypothetical protein